MSIDEIRKSFRDLPTELQLQLLCDLWAELAKRPEALDLGTEQQAELARRYEAHLADPGTAKPWERPTR